MYLALCINKNLQGSSLSLPAHGWVEVRATLLFLAVHFTKQNKNSASPEPKRSPAALLSKSRPSKKSFVFRLEEKIGCAQIKKCRENFFAEQWAKRAAAGWSISFVQKNFAPKFRISHKKIHLTAKMNFFMVFVGRNPNFF
jgi:hypothetical protein